MVFPMISLVDPDPDPERRQNDSDPHADPTPSLYMLEKSKITVVLSFSSTSKTDSSDCSHWYRSFSGSGEMMRLRVSDPISIRIHNTATTDSLENKIKNKKIQCKKLILFY